MILFAGMIGCLRRAKSASERGFDRHDKRRLTRALQKAAEIRTYRRVQAVLLVAQGRTVPEAARITGTQPWSVYRWVRAYLHTHRPDHLQDASRSGRPPVATPITDARLVREFRRDPMRLGYRATGWTVSLPADHLQQRYGCAISPRTLRRRMRDLDLRWKRPRYVYATKDSNRAQRKGGWFAA
jgi:transposase